ncbi:small GTP-binding protein [Histomonas meleagridis]|uniref:small GTP-binding protein n=1 Tax=Histomonas meleagridis TaxID=135588 RepID=UPI003559D2D1|nr:small GTP-binding protein [Histomonas meleagridis]KAH0804736.1 small GTP-binding protein [Histomonas meleagridis]
MPVLEFKVVIIGSVAVGKTSLTNLIQYSHFEEEYQATIGAGYIPYRTTFEGQEVELQIWDTAGMERYKSLGPIYYRDAVAAIIVYDQTDQDSADAVSKWYGAFHATVKTPIYVVIVGNKDDLDNKVVSNETMEEYAKANNFDFFLTSAKTGKNVNELFNSVISHLVQSKNVEPVVTSQKLQQTQNDTNQGGCC